MNADFYNGCTGAKERLATPDALRISEPGYKRGWNAYISPGAASDEGTPTEKTAPGTNSGGMSAGHNVGNPIPLHARGTAFVTAPPALSNPPAAVGPNLPNPASTVPRCFTIYPATPPADCFAH